ncbi:hypothetical protein J6590_051024 [Homalodisca vitripennis]|nr:hypothetical protein J6590_051024 [Homalodisca vitripennis]
MPKVVRFIKMRVTSFVSQHCCSHCWRLISLLIGESQPSSREREDHSHCFRGRLRIHQSRSVDCEEYHDHLVLEIL